MSERSDRRGLEIRVRPAWMGMGLASGRPVEGGGDRLARQVRVCVRPGGTACGLHAGRPHQSHRDLHFLSNVMADNPRARRCQQAQGPRIKGPTKDRRRRTEEHARNELGTTRKSKRRLHFQGSKAAALAYARHGSPITHEAGDDYLTARSLALPDNLHPFASAPIGELAMHTLSLTIARPRHCRYAS